MAETALQNENIMGTAKVSRLIITTGIPLMLSLLINSLYNFVDSVFVSHVSEDALTALSLASPVQVLVSALGLGNAVGLNAVISKALGQNNSDKVKKAASGAIFIGLCSWVLIVVMCILFVIPYSEAAIIERISGKRTLTAKAKAATSKKPNMLIDIQARMQQANSPGFERWAKIFNLKEMAKTVMYLQENGLTDLGELEKACDAAVQKYNDLSNRTKAASARMKDISELQKHIGAYSKTREIYTQYRKLPPRKQEKFYNEHSNEIRSCQAAKRYFDSLGLKKLPSIQSLKQEYATLATKNKRRYPEQKRARGEMIELLTAKNNVERTLGVMEKEKHRNHQQGER